jgi:hypothetical protein
LHGRPDSVRSRLLVLYLSGVVTGTEVPAITEIPMTLSNPWILAVLLAMLAPGSPPAARAASSLDEETLRAGLRTADPDEEAYLTYVVALLEQRRLPHAMVESTFQWARTKPRHKKFHYFKHGLMTRAAARGIRLPRGTPDLRPTITGRVVLRLLVLEIPCPNLPVSIVGTERRTVTDANGAFSFADVPYGTYTLRAEGLVLAVLRTGLARVRLPTTPPSEGPAFVEIVLQ